MKSAGSVIGSVIATAFGALASVTIFVFLLAASPNSSPAQWAMLRNAMIVTAFGGSAALVAAIVLIARGRTRAGGWIGALPLVALVLLVAWVMLGSGNS